MRIFLHSIYAFYFVFYLLVFLIHSISCIVLYRPNRAYIYYAIGQYDGFFFFIFFHYYVYLIVIMLNIEPYTQPGDYVGFHCMFNSYGHTAYVVHYTRVRYRLSIYMVFKTRNRNRISIQANCSYPDSGFIWSSIPR